MDTRAQIAPSARPISRSLAALYSTYWVAAGYSLLMVLQALGYWTLGTGRLGLCLSESLIILQHLLAIACAWIAFRRARGTAALFWLLFVSTIVILMVPNTIQALGTFLGRGPVSLQQMLPSRTGGQRRGACDRLYRHRGLGRDHRVERLLAFADDALYQAKREGRDRVVASRPLPAAVLMRTRQLPASN